MVTSARVYCWRADVKTMLNQLSEDLPRYVDDVDEDMHQLIVSTYCTMHSLAGDLKALEERLKAAEAFEREVAKFERPF